MQGWSTALGLGYDVGSGNRPRTSVGLRWDGERLIDHVEGLECNNGPSFSMLWPISIFSVSSGTRSG